jgi:hypothetical protein
MVEKDKVFWIVLPCIFVCFVLKFYAWLGLEFEL